MVVTLPQASEWHYRGRSRHEAGAIQPIPAPSGLGAQKDEGFQRFYKAVVSPTHVRVTAGGRIVPNTRGPSSPSVKNELMSEQPQNGHQEAQQSREQPVPAALAPLPLGYSTPWPGYSTGLLAPQQFPFPHMPVGFNYPGGVALPQVAINRNGYGHFGEFVAGQTLHSQGLDGAGGVGVPPAGQLDSSRPCFVNGQWMLPLGVPSFPYGLHPMAASTGYIGGQHQGPAVSHSQGQAHMPPTNPLYHGLDGQATQSTGTPATTPLGAPAHPPISSIRPSQITKSHIESLKHNLKRVEDQLQYNVHQIDVKHMEGLAREIRHSIKALDEALPRQLEFEEMHYPKSDKNDSRQGGAAFNPMTLQATAGLNGCHGALKSNGTLEQGAGSLNRGNRGLFSIEHAFPRHVSSDSEQSRQFSGLPMTAATAAPFSPSVQSYGCQVGSSSEDGCRESKDNSRKSLLSVSGKAVREAATGIAKNDHGRAARSKADVLQSNLAGQSGSSIELAVRQSPRSTPYLVGSLAPGTVSRDMGSRTFVYPRELNIEEIRARHLYWGQAPQSAMKGLPRFDGKDFYPPSPSKVRGSSIQREMGAQESSTVITDPFSSTESGKTAGHTRDTSCSEAEDLVNGSLKQQMDDNNVMRHPPTQGNL